MIHTTPSQAVPSRPLHAFMGELTKLQSNPTHPDFDALQPFLDAAVESLSRLNEAANALPDLSGGRWFLQGQFDSAMEETRSQLRKAQNSMIILTVKSNEIGDSLGFISFTAEFMILVEHAAKSPAMLQRPYALESTLNIPTPPPVDEGSVRETPDEPIFKFP